MARNDFICTGNQPGDVGTKSAPLNASEAFLPGELVFINNDGELAEFTESAGALANSTTTEAGGTWGVAAASGNTAGTGNNVVAAGTFIPFWPADGGLLFRTKNYYSTAAGTAAVPPGSIVGESFQIARTAAGAFGVNNTAATVGTHLCAKVWAVYDAGGKRIGPSDTTTGVWVEVSLHTALAVS